MSLFGTIMSKIFNHGSPAKAAAPSAPTAAKPATAPTAPPPIAPRAGVPISPAIVPAAPVDVEAVLTQMAGASAGGGGNWRTSIVDLLKLLDLDSSLAARKELGQELGIHAGADGSAEQNIALHKAVMAKLAANGGKVPASLKD